MFNKKACTECGESLGMALLNVGGRCDACHYKAAMQIADVEEAAEAKLQAEADVEAEAVAQAEQDAKIACDSVVVTTEEALPVIERLGIVGAEVVYGSGPMKDLKAGFTNMVGGRSTAVE